MLVYNIIQGGGLRGKIRDLTLHAVCRSAAIKDLSENWATQNRIHDNQR